MRSSEGAALEAALGGANDDDPRTTNGESGVTIRHLLLLT